MTVYAYAIQNAATGQSIGGLIGNQMEGEVSVPTTFETMEDALAALDVWRSRRREPWSRKLWAPVKMLR